MASSETVWAALFTVIPMGAEVVARWLVPWAFVAVTAALLYGLMRALLTGDAAGERRPVTADGNVRLRGMLAPLLLLGTTIVLATGGAILVSYLQQKEAESGRLQAVAQLRQSKTV